MSEQTKISDEPKKTKKPRFHWKKWAGQKQMGLAMILLGILLLITLGTFLKFSVLSVQGLPELLPEKDTLLYISFDFKNSGEKSEDKPELRHLLTQWASEEFAIDLEKDLKKFASGFFGFALLKSTVENDAPLPVLLAEIRDSDTCNSFLTKLSEKERPKFSQVKNFLVVSKHKEAHERIAETARNQDAFATNIAFLKASQGLPVGAFGSFAFDTASSPNPFLKPFQVFAGKWLPTSAKASLIHMAGLLREKRIIVPEQRYHADLLRYFPADSLLFLGGENLASRIYFFDRSLGLVSEILRAYGASDINVEKNLFPLFEEEYGFSLSPKNTFLLLTKIDNSKLVSLELLKRKLPSVLSIVMPDIREVTLPDGTKGKELYASTDLVTIAEEKISDIPVQIYHMKHRPFELLIGEKNGMLVISTDHELASKVFSGKVAGNFRASPVYTKKIREVLRGVNELFIAKKDWFSKNLPNEKIKEFLASYSEVALSVRYGAEVLEMFVAL